MTGYSDAVANQDATVVAQSGETITVSEADGQQWSAYERFDPAQGNHEWVAVAINTGEEDITKVTMDGVAFTQSDVDAATALGLTAGSFVLWLKADDTASYPKEIVLGTQGKENTKITIELING